MSRRRREPRIPPSQLTNQIRDIVRREIAAANKLDYVTEIMLDTTADGVQRLMQHTIGLIKDHPRGSGPEQVVMHNPTPNWDFVRAPIHSTHNDNTRE